MERQIKECDSLVEVLEDLDRQGIQGARRYRAMNSYISMKARYKDIPVSATFELTPFCNLDCKMCYVHLNKNQIKENERLLTVDEWKTIIKQSVDAGVMYAGLTGGECLIYPGFREIFLYLLALGIQPDVLTNGRALDQDMIDFFKQNPPAIIQVSLYGSSDEAYERVCGSRAYTEVINNIRAAHAAGLSLYIAVTPNRYMQKDWKDLQSLLHELKLPYSISDITLPARKETGRNISDYAVDMEAYLRMKKDELAFWSSVASSGSYLETTKYVPKTEGKIRGLPCGGAHSTFHVNWKGEMSPCIAFAQAVHFDILKDGLDRAWESTKAAMLSYSLPPECEACDIKAYCATCPGERCMGEMGGKVNRNVCERFRGFINMEIIKVNE